MLVHPVHDQMPGNAVKFGDGYATVTDYKLPMPLMKVGKAEARPSPVSQDTGLIVLVVVGNLSLISDASQSSATNFSVKEKDEASSPNCFRQNFGMPSFSSFGVCEGFFV